MFCSKCGSQFSGNFCPRCGYPANGQISTQQGQPVLVQQGQPVQVFINQPAQKSPKNRWVALVLAIFGGYFGIHRFYVGKIGSGIIYLFTVGLFGVGWIVDIFCILCGSFADKKGDFLK